MKDPKLRKLRDHSWEPKPEPKVINPARPKQRASMTLELCSVYDPAILGEAVQKALERAGIEVMSLAMRPHEKVVRK